MSMPYIRLFLPRLDSISILARNDLDLRCRHYFIRLHFEGRVLDDERPHVVAETVGMEVTLRAPGVSSSHGQGDGAEPDLERGLGLYLLDHGVSQGFVKLVTTQRCGRNTNVGWRTCCKTFIAS